MASFIAERRTTGFSHATPVHRAVYYSTYLLHFYEKENPVDPDFITKLVIIEASVVLAGQVLSAAAKHEQQLA